ncbi:hypothetical protein CEK25_012312 [Fusarium fujikuroi]|nr:hypothetical protein CEK25_012312 [Fusarium fujikuroi]
MRVSKKPSQFKARFMSSFSPPWPIITAAFARHRTTRPSRRPPSRSRFTYKVGKLPSATLSISTLGHTFEKTNLNGTEVTYKLPEIPQYINRLYPRVLDHTLTIVAISKEQNLLESFDAEIKVHSACILRCALELSSDPKDAISWEQNRVHSFGAVIVRILALADLARNFSSIKAACVGRVHSKS